MGLREEYNRHKGIQEDEELGNIVEEEIAKLKELEPSESLPRTRHDESLQQLRHNELMTAITAGRSFNVGIQESIIEKRKDFLEILIWIRKRIGKWFFFVLLLSNALSFVLGGIANQHKETVYPIIGEVYQIFNNAKKLNKD